MQNVDFMGFIESWTTNLLFDSNRIEKKTIRIIFTIKG